jgi:hypothetical protein
MLIKKIISGAQTGVDRAALDFAIKNDIPHGGWAPKGRTAEDGIIPGKYLVHEAPTANDDRGIELNVVHSDGTLIITHGEPTCEPALTRTFAEKHKKPYFHVNLISTPVFKASIEIPRWIKKYDIKILNITGSRAGKDPKIYDATIKILEAVFLLRVIDDNVSDFIYKKHAQALKAIYPEMLDGAVDELIIELPLKDKVEIAGMPEYDLDILYPSLGLYIRDKYGLSHGVSLLDACRQLSGDSNLQADDAAIFIIKKLWEKLKETYRMRIV